ncbi:MULTISPECIES: sensor histidine kinase [Paenibacillus]|uniref:Sensor histidine kinase n=1 Tax=Paenibacillus lactis 154 TaxID=743719 RepID=G4HLB7_9BACL|nr:MULTISPECIES: sensor histidine kinase [Paenibacillus]EHB56843.1 integral membrane sensor signal transduction histidine kinase [Paenibacillus lactis 154]MCM3493382.1 sensor histidine kinase [Paenibacillus lactis]GIO93078.1 sensor histidine kinase LiaS [Paenibacillus lactis]
METEKKANIITRSMREGALLGLVVMLIVLYLLYTYGYLQPFETWKGRIEALITIVLLPVGLGAIYGFYQGYRVKRRIDLVRETLVSWEKGSLTDVMPDIGEDEVGRLGEQLVRISKRWEDQVSSLQRLSTNNAQLAEQARVTAIVEERQRLARELHDAVSQQLFAISMTATAVGRTLDKDFDKAQRQVALIEEMSAVAQSEMRALLLHLRPVYLEGKALEQGLRDLIKELQIKVPMEITFEMDEDIHLVKGIENHLFRIIQEAMSNTLRHAKADKMDIRIHRRQNTVRVMLRDDGVGFELDDKKQTSYGLSTMQERVTEIGGSIQFITAPGKGTRIEITVPLMNEERKRGDSDGNTD